MRILNVTTINNGTGGGVGKHVLLLTKQLKNKDVDVVISCCADCEFKSIAVQEGHKVEIIPGKWIEIFGKKIFYFLSVNKMKYIIRKKNINLIHVHNTKGAISCIIAAKLCGLPSILTAHGGAYSNITFRFNLDHLKKYFFNKVDMFVWVFIGVFINKIIAVSDVTKKLIISLYKIKQDKVTVIYNGVDLKSFNFNLDCKNNMIKEELSLAGYFIVGSVGRIDDDKGYSYLIEAVANLSPYFSNYKLVIVGDGEKRKSLEALARKLDISNNIVFTGFRKDIAILMSTFDLFVTPSLLEGLPYVVIEAMAMKKPVIATSVGGIVNIIKHDKTGILIPPKNSDAILEAMLLLIKDKNKMSKLGEAGYKRIKDYFQLKNIVNSTYCTYRSLLK